MNKTFLRVKIFRIFFLFITIRMYLKLIIKSQNYLMISKSFPLFNSYTYWVLEKRISKNSKTRSFKMNKLKYICSKSQLSCQQYSVLRSMHAVKIPNHVHKVSNRSCSCQVRRNAVEPSVKESPLWLNVIQ